MILLKQAKRSLVRRPWFTAALIGNLALGVALSTAAFVVVDGILFRDLPYNNPTELYFPVGIRGALTVKEARMWTAVQPGLETVMYQPPFVVGSTGIGHVATTSAAAVGPGFLEFLGIRPKFGGFTASDFDAGFGPKPALISHAIWQREFGGTRDVLGQVLEIPGGTDRSAKPLEPFRVVGVLAADFVFPTIRNVPDILYPLAGTPDLESDARWSSATVIVRVKTGYPKSMAEARLTDLARSQGHLRIDGEGRASPIQLQPFTSVLVDPQKGAATLAFSAAILMLALSFVGMCALELARRLERTAETGLRLALGASERDLVKLAVAEALPLVIIGAAIGVLAAPLFLGAISTVAPAALMPLKPLALDARVGVFAAVAALTCVFLLALAGKLRRRTGLGPSSIRLRHGLAKSRPRTMTLLVAGQVAISFVLSVGGASAIRGWHEAWAVDVGFDLDHTFLVELDMTSVPLPDQATEMDLLAKRLGSLPGTYAVGSVDGWFLRQNGRVMSSGLRRPPGSLQGEEQLVSYSGDLFKALGIDLIQGHLPAQTEETERLDGYTPVALSQVAGRLMFPGEGALGKTITSMRGDKTFVVVGIVEDGRYTSLGAPSSGQIYALTPQSRLRVQPSLVVGTSLSLDRAVAAAATSIRQLGIRGDLMRIESLSSALGRTVQRETFRAWVLGSFSIAALVITGVAVMGLSATLLANRQKEFALRRAVGATGAGVIWAMLMPHLRAVGLGLLGGGILTAWLIRGLRTSQATFVPPGVETLLMAAFTVALTATVGALVSMLSARKVELATLLKGD